MHVEQGAVGDPGDEAQGLDRVEAPDAAEEEEFVERARGHHGGVQQEADAQGKGESVVGGLAGSPSAIAEGWVDTRVDPYTP